MRKRRDHVPRLGVEDAGDDVEGVGRSKRDRNIAESRLCEEGVDVAPAGDGVRDGVVDADASAVEL